MSPLFFVIIRHIFGVKLGSGFGVRGSGFKIQGSKVQGSRFRVQGSGFKGYKIRIISLRVDGMSH